MSSPDEQSHPESPQLDDQRSALSDGDLEAEKKRKRSRRKRGARHRCRPYNLTANLEETFCTSPSTSSPSEPRKKSRKVMAPNNTTQFLLEDIEARAEMEREVEEAHSAVERQRIRSLSVSSDLLVYSDESESASEQDHREFETEFEEYNMDRISKLTRDEMTREILDKDKEAEVYHSNLLRVNRENARLKRLLKDNGIPLEESPKVAIQPQAVS